MIYADVVHYLKNQKKSKYDALRQAIPYEDMVSSLEDPHKLKYMNYIKKAYAAMDLNIDPSKVIVVAGTNGKGSVCATLQTLLMAAGKNVGFFSSPHFLKVNERIKFNGKDISDDDFCRVFLAVRKKVTTSCEEAEDLTLSFFEYITAMAVYYFFDTHRENIDYAILEVGLGGALDSTNAIPHATSVIAKLGLDHESVLGRNLPEIAVNKFGIIAPRNNVFHMKFDSAEVSLLFEKCIRELHCNAIEAHACSMLIDKSKKYPTFGIRTPFGDFPMNMQGMRAVENTALAITVFDNLEPNAAKFLSAVKNVNWPGRMEKIHHKNRDIFLSGDHNPQGIESLLEILSHYKFREIHFVVGICSDKNHLKMLQKLMTLKNSHLYLTETPLKTLPLKCYDKNFLELAQFASPNPLEAFNAAVLNAKSDDLLVVTGSLYLISRILREIFPGKCLLETSRI
ncbi:MAG: hypothetical protein LBJ45_02940 [Holosporaceae bacterium]|jgi:dihydrofolate synthase/folylpolyglutamate synthase|nr:hypothetical protein [Holosporaceae bacterium]